MTTSRKTDSRKLRKPLNDYARYTSIAFQMMAVILLGVFGGMKLDAWIKPKFPVFTVILIILSVILAIYLVIKDLLKKK